MDKVNACASTEHSLIIRSRCGPEPVRSRSGAGGQPVRGRSGAGAYLVRTGNSGQLALYQHSTGVSISGGRNQVW